MKFASHIFDALFPEGIKCIVCDGELFEENRYGVCERCKLDFNLNYCQVCGRGMGAAGYCDACKRKDFAFDLARAPFLYSGEIKSLVYSLKYGDAQWLSPYMAQFMADVLMKMDVEFDCITYVPLHIKRQKQRGYNQAKLIADELAGITELPVVEGLTRVKHTKNLAKMKKDERKAVVEGMFEICDKPSVKDKQILLIDDVLTSGTTADACAATLKDGGAVFVAVLTFATSRIKPLLY